MKWPEYFPNNCPPDDAQQLFLTVYILVQTPIQVEDFFSLRVRKSDKTFVTSELECQACGVSVFEKIEHIKRVKQRVRRLRDRAIGMGKLTPDMGVVKPTSSQFGNSHRTWWIPVGIEPWNAFQIIKEEA